jgi:ferritin-like metal-binding protein YciE
VAGYGSLRTWAAALGKNEAMQILEVTLEEEKNADALLTNMREPSIYGQPTRSEKLVLDRS